MYIDHDLWRPSLLCVIGVCERFHVSSVYIEACGALRYSDGVRVEGRVYEAHMRIDLSLLNSRDSAPKDRIGARWERANCEKCGTG